MEQQYSQLELLQKVHGKLEVYAYTGVSTSFTHYPWAQWTYGGTVVTATGSAV